MTDARFPERWLMDRRMMRLSDAAFRDFSISLIWCVANRTDGHLEPDDLVLIPGFRAAHATEYVSAGLWERDAGGWVVVDFAETQTSRHELEVLESARRRDREKKRRRRARPRDAEVPEDRPGDASPGTAEDRTGEDRTGQAQRSARPRQELDDDEEWRRRVMAGRGISDFDAVLKALRQETARPIPEVDAVLIVGAILDRANGRVRSPQAYVLKSIRENWAEIQRQHDTADVAA